MSPRSFPKKFWIPIATCCLAFAIMLFLRPIAQNPDYHDFADTRRLFGIPNFWNVISNLAFLIPGMLGLRYCNDMLNDRWCAEETEYRAFFLGTLGVGIGSAYYHAWPSTPTLFWDRLPMTVCFMAITAIVISERVREQTNRSLLAWLLAFGVGSVIYWRQTELAGAGDLRPYILVQFLPLITLPMICWLFPERQKNNRHLAAAIGWYTLAKLLEVLDFQVFSLGEIVSGHTLKHIASGIGCWHVLRSLQIRNLPSKTPVK